MRRDEPKVARRGLTQGLALAILVILGVIAVAGPSGLMAWGENNRQLRERQEEVKRLAAERDELRNRVALLNPDHADPDLAGELLRRNLNVVHPDEMVMMLDK